MRAGWCRQVLQCPRTQAHASLPREGHRDRYGEHGPGRPVARRAPRRGPSSNESFRHETRRPKALGFTSLRAAIERRARGATAMTERLLHPTLPSAPDFTGSCARSRRPLAGCTAGQDLTVITGSLTNPRYGDLSYRQGQIFVNRHDYASPTERRPLYLWDGRWRRLGGTCRGEWQSAAGNVASKMPGDIDWNTVAWTNADAGKSPLRTHPCSFPTPSRRRRPSCVRRSPCCSAAARSRCQDCQPAPRTTRAVHR